MSRKDFKNLNHLNKEDDQYVKAVQELVAVVRSTANDKINKKSNFMDDFLEFITDMQVKSGQVAIPAFLIYFEYYKWTQEQPRHGFKSFCIQLEKKFHKKRYAFGAVYLLSKNTFPQYSSMSNQEFRDLKKELMKLEIFKWSRQDAQDNRQKNYASKQGSEETGQQIQETTEDSEET